MLIVYFKILEKGESKRCLKDVSSLNFPKGGNNGPVHWSTDDKFQKNEAIPAEVLMDNSMNCSNSYTHDLHFSDITTKTNKQYVFKSERTGCDDVVSDSSLLGWKNHSMPEHLNTLPNYIGDRYRLCYTDLSSDSSIEGESNTGILEYENLFETNLPSKLHGKAHKSCDMTYYDDEIKRSYFEFESQSKSRGTKSPNFANDCANEEQRNLQVNTDLVPDASPGIKSKQQRDTMRCIDNGLQNDPEQQLVLDQISCSNQSNSNHWNTGENSDMGKLYAMNIDELNALVLTLQSHMHGM